MVTRNKNNTTNRVLSQTGCWEGAIVPVSGDIARWYSASNTAGNHTTAGSTFDQILVEGGSTTNIAFTSGTITFSGSGDFFVNSNSSGRSFQVNGGILAIGSGNRNASIHSTSGSNTLRLDGAAAISSNADGILNIVNALNDGNAFSSYIVAAGVFNAFVGTLRLTAGTGVFTEAATGAAPAFNAASIVCDGASWLIAPGTSNFIGNAAKTLTINFDGSFGVAGRSLTVQNAVALAGTGTRTLTVSGNTGMTGTVTGTAGVTVAGASKYIYLYWDNATTSGLTGPCTVSSGDFQIRRTTAPYVPSTLSIAADARFFYYASTSDYTFDVTPTGLGTVCIAGNFAGNGVTFPASPTTGNIATFDGRVAMRPNSGNNPACKIRISELPGSLGWLSYADGATTFSAATTYTGAGQTKATTLLIDSEINTNTATLTSSTYSLLSSGSGPIVLSGAIERTNSAGTASARMSLTLGGTNTGDNTLSGDISETASPLNGAILGITKTDAGRWVLSGANSSHTGIHTISAGTLSAQSAKALGSATSAGGVTISGTGTLELSGGITIDKSSTPFTVHASSPIKSVGDNTIQTAGITLGGTTTFDVTTGNRLAIVNSGAITDGANTYGLTKTGAGELSLAAFSNTYDGTVTVSAGTLAIGSMGALGTGNVALTGTLKYTGTGETISRTTQLVGSGPSLEAAGSGAVTFSGLTQDTTAKTLTLMGSSTASNTIPTALANNTGALSLAKSDAGKWVLTGALSYTGTTAVNGGTLRVQTANSNTTSGAVTIGASGTVELITDTLATASSSSGEVLGTGNVTCNGGIIKTRGGTTQKGQVRYGGNLTLGSGSTLYIGAAA